MQNNIRKTKRNRQLENKRLEELSRFNNIKFYPEKVDLWPEKSWSNFIKCINEYNKPKK